MNISPFKERKTIKKNHNKIDLGDTHHIIEISCDNH